MKYISYELIDLNKESKRTKGQKKIIIKTYKSKIDEKTI